MGGFLQPTYKLSFTRSILSYSMPLNCGGLCGCHLSYFPLVACVQLPFTQRGVCLLLTKSCGKLLQPHHTRDFYLEILKKCVSCLCTLLPITSLYFIFISNYYLGQNEVLIYSNLYILPLQFYHFCLLQPLRDKFSFRFVKKTVEWLQ